MAAKYRDGEVVMACSSGKLYVVLSGYPLDEHGSFGYAVKRWRNSKQYGPTRQMAECDLRSAKPLIND